MSPRSFLCEEAKINQNTSLKKELCEIGEEAIWESRFTCFFFFFLVYVLCRRGNDSQRAVKIMKNLIDDPSITIKDVIGGIHAWAREIDTDFPIY